MSNKRWSAAPGMGVTLDITESWVAVNELGERTVFLDHMAAYQWAWRNWELCTACHERRPFHPEHRVCRGCGAHWGDGTSCWTERRNALAAFLYGMAAAESAPWAEADPEFIENYTADAVDILLSMPHLLPLDVRESMIDESEDA